jgi:hypothetical protein
MRCWERYIPVPLVPLIAHCWEIAPKAAKDFLFRAIKNERHSLPDREPPARSGERATPVALKLMSATGAARSNETMSEPEVAVRKTMMS